MVARQATDNHNLLNLHHMRVNVQGASISRCLGTNKSEFELKLAIASFCDPDTYPNAVHRKQMSVDGKVKFCFVLHPKKVNTLDDEVLKDLQNLSDDPLMVALGEVGLDYHSQLPIRDQLTALERLLPLACAGDRNLPVVLHCRERRPIFNFATVHVMEMLEEVYPENHPIYLHSFNGDKDTVRKWKRQFISVYFGFSLLIARKDAHPNRVSAVRTVDIERLLLETDSPHLSNRLRSINTPNAVFKVAEVIARMRDMTPKEVITQSTLNAICLFGV